MPDIKALAPLIGRWATTITMITPAKQTGEVYRAVDTYRWMTGEKVVVHEVEARMGPDAVSSLEIYALVGGEIVSRSFDASGEVSDYRAVMQHGGWKITGETQRFESTSLEDNRIEGLWQRLEGKDWKDWMTVRLERVS